MAELGAQFWLRVAATAIVLVVLGIIYACWRIRRKAQQSARWPTVWGTVLSSEVDTHHDSDGNTMYTAQVRYKYQVGRQAYESDRFEWGGRVSTNRPQDAEAIVARYPVGKSIKVHYDPTDPAVAVLEPLSLRGIKILVFVAAVFGVVGLAFLAATFAGF